MAQTVELKGDQVRIGIARIGGLPVFWEACRGACADPGSRRTAILSEAGDGNTLRWAAPGNADLEATMRGAEYLVEVNRDAGRITVTLRSREPVGGRVLSHRYALNRAGHVLHGDIDLPTGVTLELAAGSSFVPELLPGFGAIYGSVRSVIVSPAGQQTLEPQTGETLEPGVAAGDWAGIRNRFWTWLARSADSPLAVAASLPGVNRPALSFRAGPGDSRLVIDVYGGPVSEDALTSGGATLTGMLFAALWAWLRALCFGLLFLLTAIDRVVGNAGISIILLSLSVKILMWPLTRVADRWQADVNRTQAMLQPRLDAIKREYKGEEAHNRVLRVYREQGVNPMYTLKSLAGFLIQIPVFIAAFDMLGENFALHATSFLWIDDLAKPDRLVPLPFTLPFFGGHLNLLPFLMTGFTVLASMLQTDPALTPKLLRQQRLRLYLMAAAFFVLFYTFPAGMVLYWTTNNVLHLIKLQFATLFTKRVSTGEEQDGP